MTAISVKNAMIRETTILALKREINKKKHDKALMLFQTIRDRNWTVKYNVLVQEISDLEKEIRDIQYTNRGGIYRFNR